MFFGLIEVCSVWVATGSGRPYAGSMTDLGAPLLLNDLADALREQHPLVFLEAASSLAQVTAPDPLAGLRPNEEASNHRSRERAWSRSFLDVGERETDALLHVWAEMFDDSALKERLRTSGPRHSVPQWHRRLDQIRPVRVIENTHILGDGDNLYIGVETAGRSFTLVVYVDQQHGHHREGLLRDGSADPRNAWPVSTRFRQRATQTCTRSFSRMPPRS